MERFDSASGFPGYSNRGYTRSNRDEDPEWFSVEIRINGKSFKIHVSLSEFHDSPRRTEEFYKCFACLESQMDMFEDEDIGSQTNDNHRFILNDRFDWAVTPFLPTFRKLAPEQPAVSKITLQDFFASETYECELSATNDELVAGTVTLLDPEDHWINFEDESSYWTPVFPSIDPSQVEIISSDPQHTLDYEPRRVRVGSQEFFFKSCLEIGQAELKIELEKYEKIAQAKFGPDVRTSRLFGVVRTYKNQLLGLLLDPIEEKTTLLDALDPEEPETMELRSEANKIRWAKQIQNTVAALHGAGIIWGDAKPGNIIIDRHGDEWIIDFGGGYTEGWVDGEKAGSIEGDLQGLQRILKYIYTGQLEGD